MDHQETGCDGRNSLQQTEDFFTSQLDFNLKKKLVKCYIRSIAFYGAETCTLWKDQKYLENFEIWCAGRWRMSVGQIVRKMKYDIELSRKGISYIE